MHFKVSSCAVIAASLIACDSVASQIDVNDPSFEEQAPGTVLQSSVDANCADPGHWGVDRAKVVTAQNGITPLDGEQMLHRENHGRATDHYQVVDVSVLAGAIDAGKLDVTWRVSFNGLIDGAGIDLSITPLATCDEPTAEVLHAFGTELFEGPGLEAGQWQTLSMDRELPKGTRLIRVGIHMEDGNNYATYADNAVLQVSDTKINT